MSRPASERLALALAAPGYLAIWVSLHVAAGVFCAADLAGLQVDWEICVAAFGSTLGAYILDRVKLRDAWNDPADRQAHPARERFLRNHSTILRFASAAAIIVAAVAAWRIHPLAAALPPAAALGASLYALRPQGRRAVKDRLIVKNAAVALAVAALAAALLFFDRLGQSPTGPIERIAPRIVAACAFLAGQVLGDAALCDIPDIDSDRAHGTATIAARLGPRPTWTIALLLDLALIVGAGLAHAAGFLVAPAWWRWSALLFIGTALLALAPRRALRDLADLRIPAVAAIILLWRSL